MAGWSIMIVAGRHSSIVEFGFIGVWIGLENIENELIPLKVVLILLEAVLIL